MNTEAKQAYNEYMRNYMKKYRTTEKGNKICKEAKERFYTKKFKEGGNGSKDMPKMQ